MVRAQEFVSERARERPRRASVTAVPTLGPAAPRLSPATVLLLQRSAGNAAVTALLRRRNEEGEEEAGSSCSCDEGTAPENRCASCSAAQGSGQTAESSSAPSESAPGTEDASEEGAGEVSLGNIQLAQREPVEVEVFAAGPTLEGKTTAHFNGSTPILTPNPPKASRAKGCPDCGDENCIRAQGTTSASFASTPTVELPDLDGYDFTDCQRKNAEKFVKNVLSPHEQLHVKAFTSKFDGAWKKAFDLKVCGTDDASAKIQDLYDTELERRRAKAQAASDDLDTGGKNKFTWDMDEGCPKP